ncbi:hypothetical protein CRYUN_Cryun36dG0007600 [Craigia yunnanensis]
MAKDDSPAVVRNKRVILRDYVTGFPKESDMYISFSNMSLKIPETRKGVVLPITGFGVAKVLDSTHQGFEEGDFVWGTTGWEEYSFITRPERLFKIRHSDLKDSFLLCWDSCLMFGLGVFIHVCLAIAAAYVGMPGMTACAGFYEVCSPKRGEYVFISVAFGAVGQLVGQLAKLGGCFVGSAALVFNYIQLLKERFGFDDAFNYKEEHDLDATLKRYFPEGIDIYFENVRGKMRDVVLLNMRVHGRIAVCGMISQYNLEQPEGIKNLMCLIYRRIRMEGFVVFDFCHLYSKFLDMMLPFIREERIACMEDIAEGLVNAPEALIGIFSGHSIGKKVVKVAPE